MKILHIINDLSSGGAEKLISDILPLMKKSGHDVEVLLLSNRNNVFVEQLIDNSINVVTLKPNKIRSIRNLYHLRKYVNSKKFDIIHAHLFPANYLTSIVSKLNFNDKTMYVLTEHNTHNRRRDLKIIRPIEKFIYNSFDKIISISKGTQFSLKKWLKNIKEEKFITINNGINIERFKHAKKYNKNELNNIFVDENIILVMTGRFTNQKDQKTIIKALKNLDDNIHLLLVGEGPLLDDHISFVKELNLEDRVHFMGFRNDVERIVKSSDLVIVSSNWEGFGLVAVEGMAAGKPVIASEVPGLEEIVSGYGVLFTKNDHNELSNKIKELLSNKKIIEKYSLLSLRRSNEYDITSMADKYLKVYENLLKKED